MLGKTHAKAVQHFRDLNPELTFRIFTAEERDAYMAHTWPGSRILDLYERSRFGAMKADIFRYCILFTEGGYYFDINKGCSVPLQSLHDQSTRGLISFEGSMATVPGPLDAFQALRHPLNFVCQWGLGFEPEHPLLAAVIQRIEDLAPEYIGKEFGNPKAAIVSLTGPGVVTDVVRANAGRLKEFGIVQTGLDFDGRGIYRMPRSAVRYGKTKPYAELRNLQIC